MRKYAFSIAVISLVCVLLLVSIALAQSSGESDQLAWYIVEQGMASGRGYHLISLVWQASGTASGGEYRLLSPAAPMAAGNGCCCTYLPCVIRNH